ncbi:MAG: PilZ domain-containing protein [Treponema sp.]|jgi:hypothetical protein|nr:PilZ domain-containing protein [Treponema sp.]
MENIEITGKKIFFLYPQTIVRNEVVSDLVMQEFEAYIVQDHVALRRVLKDFPNSIVFVNLDEKTVPEKEWAEWIHGIMTDPVTKQTSIGLLSSNASDDIKQKYLIEAEITCGFTHISTDLKKVIAHLYQILMQHNAMGRRKYIRITTDGDAQTTANMLVDGHFISASIRDISSAGFSCIFPQDPGFQKGALVPDIQLKLQSSLIRTEAIVLGSHPDELTQVYVFVFTPRTDSDVRFKIRKYIHTAIQNKMDIELKK